EKNINLFEKHKVLNEREICSRREIWIGQYLTTINIEVDTTEDMAKTMIYPATIRYMNELAENVKRIEELKLCSDGSKVMLQKVNNGLNNLNKALEKLRRAVLKGSGQTLLEKANYVHENVIPA